MRALLPRPDDAPRSDDNVDVHAFYAADWLERGGLRVNFVTSVDGAAQAMGKSRGLQTAGDNIVFAALRDLADVVLVGSGTVTAERYRPVHFSPDGQRIRSEYGLAPATPIAITTRSLRLDPDDGLFTDTEPGAQTIVLTCASSDAGRRDALASVADVVVCGEETVDPALVRRALEDRGLTRILSEGGPTAFADLAAGGVVDELCLSLSPLLVGPGAGRITAGDSQWSTMPEMELTGLLEGDSALFLRYRLSNSVADQ